MLAKPWDQDQAERIRAAAPDVADRIAALKARMNALRADLYNFRKGCEPPTTYALPRGAEFEPIPFFPGAKWKLVSEALKAITCEVVVSGSAVLPGHYHDSDERVVILGGSMALTIEGDQHWLNEGAAISITAGQFHRAEVPETGVHYLISWFGEPIAGKLTFHTGRTCNLSD